MSYSPSVVLTSLQNQLDVAYNEFSIKTISGLFKEDYNLHKAGEIYYFNEPSDDYIQEIKKFSEDTSFDEAFNDKVNLVHKLEEKIIIDGFIDDFRKIFQYIADNKYETQLQSIFIEYDFYYHATGIAEGYGSQDYPLVLEPRYISSEIDYSKSVFQCPHMIDFKTAWVSCEEFEWTEDYIQINYTLQRLFQLKSRVLLYKALSEMEKQKELVFLSIRPFTFYINEHDSEVMTLYRLD